MSYKKATNDWYATIHHAEDPSKVTDDAFTKLRSAAKSDSEKNDAETKIRMFKKKQGATNTFENKAIKKVTGGMNKSSVGNHILGWFSPKHAR